METKTVKVLTDKKLGATLKKLKLNRTVAPFSETVQVKGGIMYASNIHLTLAFHTELEDGTYRADLAVQGVFVKFENETFVEKNEWMTNLEHDYKSLKPIQDDLIRASVVRGKDELRPTMKGFYISPTIIAATDAHRLFFKEGEFEYGEFILPTEMLDVMKGFKKEGFSIATAQESEYAKKVYVKFDYGYMIQNAIDGKYPNVRAVIPKDHVNFATIDKAELLSAVAELKPFVVKDTQQVAFEFTNGGVIMTAENLDLSLKHSVTNKCKTELYAPNSETESGVDSFVIGMNRKFLEDVLKAIPETEIKLKMSGSNRAIILNDEFLIMPVMVN